MASSSSSSWYYLPLVKRSLGRRKSAYLSLLTGSVRMRGRGSPVPLHALSCAHTHTPLQLRLDRVKGIKYGASRTACHPVRGTFRKTCCRVPVSFIVQLEIGQIWQCVRHYCVKAVARGREYRARTTAVRFSALCFYAFFKIIISLA